VVLPIMSEHVSDDTITIGGWRIKPVGIGTWQAGSRMWGTSAAEEAINAIVEALSSGLNFIDTAEIYGWGRSEVLVGEALRRYGSSDVLVATKIAGCNARPGQIVKRAEASRRRLGVDAIGLYQLHWPPSIYTDECRIVWELESLVDKGIVHMIGVCNYDWDELEKLLYCTRKHEIVSDQVEYSLVQRAPERRLFETLRKHGMTLIGWGTLAKGALAGKTRVDNIARLLDPSFYAAAKNWELQEAIREIAEKHGVSRAAVAIRWSIEKGAVPLVGLRRRKHVKSLIEALTFSLTSEELDRLDRITKRYLGRGFTRVAPRIIPNIVICALYRLFL